MSEKNMNNISSPSISYKNCMEINSKHNTVTWNSVKFNNVKKESNKVFSQKEVGELKNAILGTIRDLGGDEVKPEPKILRAIGLEANVYWGAIQQFLEDKYTPNILTKIAEAFSSVNVIEGITPLINHEVELANAIMNKNVQAVTVSWWYPPMSPSSIYKDAIRFFNDTICSFQSSYWEKYKEVKGDELELLDFREFLETSEINKELFNYDFKEKIGDHKPSIDIYHQILPSYMQRLTPKEHGNDDMVISAFYVVFNWKLFLELGKIDKLFSNNESNSQDAQMRLIYEPRFNSLVTKL